MASGNIHTGPKVYFDFYVVLLRYFCCQDSMQTTSLIEEIYRAGFSLIHEFGSQALKIVNLSAFQEAAIAVELVYDDVIVLDDPEQVMISDSLTSWLKLNARSDQAKSYFSL